MKKQEQNGEKRTGIPTINRVRYYKFQGTHGITPNFLDENHRIKLINSANDYINASNWKVCSYTTLFKFSN